MGWNDHLSHVAQVWQQPVIASESEHVLMHLNRPQTDLSLGKVEAKEKR